MSGSNVNPVRGETSLTVGGRRVLLRPTFEALVAAEEELGPLFGLVERAGQGELRLTEIAALFWHCSPATERPSREEIGAAVLEAGLAEASRPLKALLGEILRGAA